MTAQSPAFRDPPPRPRTLGVVGALAILGTIGILATSPETPVRQSEARSVRTHPPSVEQISPHAHRGDSEISADEIGYRSTLTASPPRPADPNPAALTPAESDEFADPWEAVRQLGLTTPAEAWNYLTDYVPPDTDHAILLFSTVVGNWPHPTPPDFTSLTGEARPWAMAAWASRLAHHGHTSPALVWINRIPCTSPAKSYALTEWVDIAASSSPAETLDWLRRSPDFDPDGWLAERIQSMPPARNVPGGLGDPADSLPPTFP